MKKIFSILFVSLVIMGNLIAEEQYTRIAIVDVGKVYTQFFKESKEARELEDLKGAIKKDVDRLSEEIKGLKAQKADFINKGDTLKISELDSQIIKKESALNEFKKVRQDQYNAKREALMKGESFLKRLLEEIDFIAKANGFAIILNSKTEGLLYYNQEVDITQEIINRLSGK